MIRRTLKLLGRRISGSWGRASKKYGKRKANKASRKFKQDQEKFRD